jgi:Ca-activated chloride channel family protein
VSLTAPQGTPRRERAPVNIALVLDRSGSMGGTKILLAREAAERALQMLRPTDRFSLVVYDDRIDMLVESTPATSEAVRNAQRRLHEIGARGSTNLGDGWLRGCEQVAAHTTADAISRTLILTDGLANVGIVDPDELSKHAAGLKERGVSTSTFGVGADFDERLLQAMADNGGGHFYYIERPEQILDLLTSELGDTLDVVARDAALDFSLPAGVQAEVLNAVRTTRSASGLRCELGDLVSNQEVSVVLAVQCPAGAIGDRVEIECRVRDRESVLQSAPARVAWTVASKREDDVQPRDPDVTRQVAELQAEQARRDALEANRRGDFVTARDLVFATAQGLRDFGGDDAAVGGIASALEADERAFTAPMSAPTMKARFFSQESRMRNRTVEGKTKKKE